MDSKMEQIFELITSSLLNNARNKKIGEVIKENEGKHNYPCTNEYDSYTIEQFIVLYKIKYLNYLAIIDDETAKTLEKLYLYRIELNRSMGDLAYEDLLKSNKKNEQKIRSLYEKVNKIDLVLNKYHLLVQDNDYDISFYTSIENADYSNSMSSDEIKALIRELKR